MPNILEKAWGYAKKHPSAVAAMTVGTVLGVMSLGALDKRDGFGEAEAFMTGIFCRIQGQAGIMIRGALEIAGVYGGCKALENAFSYSREKCQRTSENPVTVTPGADERKPLVPGSAA